MQLILPFGKGRCTTVTGLLHSEMSLDNGYGGYLPTCGGRFLNETLILFSGRRGQVPCLLLSAAPGSTIWEVLNLPWFSFAPYKMDIVAYALLKGFLIKGVWELRVILSLLIFRQIQLSQRFRRLPVHLLAISSMCQEPHPHLVWDMAFKTASFLCWFLPTEQPHMKSDLCPESFGSCVFLDICYSQPFYILFPTVHGPVAVGFPIFKGITFPGSVAFHFC